MKGLKNLRKQAGVSFRELQDLSGIEAGELCKAEHGERKLSAVDVYLLRRILTLQIAERAGQLREAIGAAA